MKEISIKCWIAKDKVAIERVYETGLFVNKPKLGKSGNYKGDVYVPFVEIYPQLKKLRKIVNPGERQAIEIVFRNVRPRLNSHKKNE